MRTLVTLLARVCDLEYSRHRTSIVQIRLDSFYCAFAQPIIVYGSSTFTAMNPLADVGLSHNVRRAEHP